MSHLYLVSNIAQLIIAISIVIVWVYRHDNIVSEFKKYKLSPLTRDSIGAIKIAISTLLVAGIWYSIPLVLPALVMAVLMGCAQYFHYKAGHAFKEFVPSLCLLILSLFVAGVRSGIIK